MAGNGRAPMGRRVVMFPFPFGSHITPMLQLAELLRARGFGVTVLHTEFNAPDPARHPELSFVSIRESLPGVVLANPDTVQQVFGLNDACEVPFQVALEELERGGEVACAVVDVQWYKMLGAARDADVPAFALCADGASTFFSMLATPRLHADGYVPIRGTENGERLDEAVPGLEPLRARDLIRIDGSRAEAVLRFHTCVGKAIWAFSSGLVFNTFVDIEGPELAKIQGKLCRMAFAVGPLHLVSPAPVGHGQPHAPDRSCLAWLDAQPPRSVLYVSLGSTVRVDYAMFDDMAWALAGSGVPFLWVLRRDFVRGADEVPPFPEELQDTMRSRGKIVAWSPQREVLAHPAVGGFWTHCGWNSTMEAICEGVPMLVQPRSTAGRVTARYVTHQWGTGFEVGDVFDRTTKARTIRKLMVAELGPLGPTERARLLKIQARQCAAEGGPASVALGDLVDYILALC